MKVRNVCLVSLRVKLLFEGESGVLFKGVFLKRRAFQMAFFCKDVLLKRRYGGKTSFSKASY